MQLTLAQLSTYPCRWVCGFLSVFACWQDGNVLTDLGGVVEVVTTGFGCRYSVAGCFREHEHGNLLLADETKLPGEVKVVVLFNERRAELCLERQRNLLASEQRLIEQATVSTFSTQSLLSQ